MRELEKDQNKENEPARRSLEFGIPEGGGDSFSRIKPSESNVGIGKRARSSSPEFDGFESFENSISSPNPYLGTKRAKDTNSKESTPTNKRLKTSDGLSQFSQVRNKETSDVISSDPPLLELHDDKFQHPTILHGFKSTPYYIFTSNPDLTPFTQLDHTSTYFKIYYSFKS